jgi:hypothetical protein
VDVCSVVDVSVIFHGSIFKVKVRSVGGCLCLYRFWSNTPMETRVGGRAWSGPTGSVNREMSVKMALSRETVPLRGLQYIIYFSLQNIILGETSVCSNSPPFTNIIKLSRIH